MEQLIYKYQVNQHTTLNHMQPNYFIVCFYLLIKLLLIFVQALKGNTRNNTPL